MASAVLQSFGQLPATTSAAAVVSAAAHAQTPAASVIVSSMQTPQVTQNPQSTGISTTQMISMANGHSRSTSVVDGFISMFPVDGSSSGTPMSGMAVSAASSGITQPMAAHLKMQLQQHQQLQQQQHQHQQNQQQQQAQIQSQLHAQSIQSGNISASGSASASANHSGVPSPLSYSSAAANAPALLGHRRQMSSTVPSAIHHTQLSQPQPQPQAQQLLFIDTPMTISTAPPTLVPGTPTTFGQLQFPMQQQVAASAVATPLQQTMPTHGFQNHHHGHHSHLGHSRHLSLDTANLRLMTADVSSLHETIPEHPAEHAQGMQFGAANSISLAQQLQLHSQMQQLQAQSKANPSPVVRTMPVTPQHPSVGSFAAGLQVASLSEPTLQQLQTLQQQSIQQPPRQRQMFMHHSSCSVDLGSLSSAFNVAQFNQTLSGQISPMAINPASMGFGGAGGDIHSMHYAFSHNPQLMALSHAPTLAASRATTDAVSADDFEDDDVDEDDDDADADADADNSIDEKPVGSSSASGSKSQGAKASAGKTGSASGSSTPKPKKVSAPYKRFRNSFIFFANERRKQWRREHPEVSKIQNRGFIQDMSKVWNNMTAEEKAPYIKMAEEDKVRYEADVKKFGPLPSSNGSSSTAAISAPIDASASAAAAAASKSKGKAASVNNAGAFPGSEHAAASASKMPNVVPIAPAPVAAITVSSSAPASAPVDVASSTAQSSAPGAAISVATASTITAAPAPAPAPVAVSDAPVAVAPSASADGPAPAIASTAAPAVANTSADVVLSSGNAALLVAPVHLASDPSAGIAQPSANAASAIAASSSVVVPMMSAAALDAMDLDNVMLAQHTYQVWLQQALGQDFSPQTIEFDPSCFVASDPTSADEANGCVNTQSLTMSTDSVPQQLSAAPSEGMASSSESSGKVQITGSAPASATASTSASAPSSSSNGPLITTLVGTKRKSSSDGQPMTNLPMSIKRFRNSFIYFVNERRREIQFNSDGTPTNVEVNNREFLKEMSAKWRTMSEDEKAPYLKMADADKERFTKQMREYELEHPEEFVKAPRHKRRRSSTGASNVSIASIPADVLSKALEQQQQQQTIIVSEDAGNLSQAAAMAAGGLNISLLNASCLPVLQSTSASFATSGMSLAMDTAQVQQQLQFQQQVLALTTTPMSTAHNTPLTTPLLSPNVPVEKADMAISAATHFPSLPSVPEEMTICTEAFSGGPAGNGMINIGNGNGSGNGSGGSSSTVLSTLPTLVEAADEDVNMG
ncbi:high mobility group [Coemansia sp. RSA 2598]|nr:high mobility group [Coemansia sp. RSA 2598]